jgi:DME family drug/metabolite transporter
MRRTATGPVLVLAAAALWGTTGTAQALGPPGISPGTVAAVRMAGGSTLLLYACLRGRTVPLRSMLGPALVAAIIAMAASQPLFFTGVRRTGVAVGTIVTIGSGPILAGLLGWAVRGERVGRRWLMATVLSLGGAMLMVSGGSAAGIDAAGLLFALGAGLAWAVYLVSARSLLDDHPEVFVIAIVFAAAAVLLAPWFVVSHPAWIASRRGAAVAAWFVVTTALSYILFATGLRSTPVAAAATLSLSEPLTAAVLGMTVLDEPARATTMIGILLVAAGLFVLSAEQPVEPLVD